MNGSGREPPHALTLVRRFGPLVLLLAGLGLALASGLLRKLSLHELHRERLQLLTLAHLHPALSLSAYVAVYIGVVGLSLPGALIMTLTGGLLFGPWLGGLAAAIGCTLGSGVIFLVCRTALGQSLRGRAGALIDRIERGVKANAFTFVIALRLIPIAPLWLANLALAFIEIPLTVFVAATFIGILPVSIVFAGIGSSLNRIFAGGGRADLHALISPATLAPLAGLGVLALAPMLFRRLRRGRSS